MAPFESEFHVVVVREPMMLYRVCHTDRVGSEPFLNDLRSNYERGRRRRHLDVHAIVIHMALSTFDDLKAARRMSHQFPHQLGEYVATLTIEPGLGVCAARTAGPRHWSIWGDPLQLRGCVDDVARA